MLGLVTLPFRSAAVVARIVLRATERDVVAPLEHDLVTPLEESLVTETHILDAVTAIHRATASIEQHVEVIDTLANSVAPLGASVDRLTDTMQELVALMAPMGAAERGVHNVERFFGRHRHKD